MEELASIVNKPLASAEVQQVLQGFSLVEELIGPLEEGMPSERFLRDKAGGLQVEVRSDGRIGTVFIHSFGKDGFGQFQRPLVGGLTFSSTRSDVLSALGNPSAGAVLEPPVLGVISWAKYESPLHSIHFSFGTNGISLVTIMPADWQPGGNASG